VQFSRTDKPESIPEGGSATVAGSTARELTVELFVNFVAQHAQDRHFRGTTLKL
jgi:hypothetical protein